MKRKIFIGFTTKTSAVWPKFFCPLFRHVVIVTDGVLIQVGLDGVRAFRVRAREIQRLERAGWVFLELRVQSSEFRVSRFGLLTCVGFAKRAAGIRNPLIWTPDQLFRAIARNKIKSSEPRVQSMYRILMHNINLNCSVRLNNHIL